MRQIRIASNEAIWGIEVLFNNDVDFTIDRIKKIVTMNISDTTFEMLQKQDIDKVKTELYRILSLEWEKINTDN